mgnify:CR=1 FL=1
MYFYEKVCICLIRLVIVLFGHKMDENNMEENMEAYIGEPKLEEHVRRFLEIRNPNVLAFYLHRRQVFIELKNQAMTYQPWLVADYGHIIARWAILIEIYNHDVVFVERVNFDWCDWHQRHPIHVMRPPLIEEDDDSGITQ